MNYEMTKKDRIFFRSGKFSLEAKGLYFVLRENDIEDFTLDSLQKYHKVGHSEFNRIIPELMSAKLITKVNNEKFKVTATDENKAAYENDVYIVDMMYRGNGDSCGDIGISFFDIKASSKDEAEVKALSLFDKEFPQNKDGIKDISADLQEDR